MQGQIISIVNNKGGVGKTTVAVNLAHALTRRSQRVLVVDTDSQCNATSILYSKDPGKNTLYEVFAEPDVNVEQCIYPTEYEKLFCLPNTNDTSALEPPLLRDLPGSFPTISTSPPEFYNMLKITMISLFSIAPRIWAFLL